MTIRLPLSTLLSQTLVAFTIEFDNEAERRMPHTTTRHGSSDQGKGPWLVSMVMYLNCMQYVDEQGLTVREVVKRARTMTNFRGMYRWGYITIRPDAADTRPKPPRAEWIVHAKPAGRRAQEIWKPLFEVIEQRWRERFGKKAFDALKESLAAIHERIELDLPDCLPILGYGLWSTYRDRDKDRSYRKRSTNLANGTGLPLAVLLSRVILLLAIEFEEEAEISLALSANVVRVLASEASLVRELPRKTGISKEAVAMSLSFLTKQGYAVIEKDPSGVRAKIVRLTKKGFEVYDEYERLLRKIDQRWRKRFGEEAIGALRKSLEQIVGQGDENSPLFQGLAPDPRGWRGRVPKTSILPHYPVVLHRGGFPDGS